ncbi:MAG: hypothetical protein EI684_02675 [Candidatus Viridilinea halotolerans]|uniref:Uncharacterized protein n=1 Tax=Candidatus Viridilinea halotolerans TaxID=2491704 RepID=A0A426U8N5_9CHLR|nr:MAG: hypothetical protein EI684_02675 [Candidatus Viridilinea halotolerans]
MNETSFWQRIFNAIEKEYDRRIRAASLVTAYGAAHHGHHHDDHHEENEDDAAEIVNVPRGTRIKRP